METSFDNLNDEQLISLYNALKVQRQEYKEDIEASEQRLSERGLFYLDKKELEPENEPRKILKKISN